MRVARSTSTCAVGAGGAVGTANAVGTVGRAVGADLVVCIQPPAPHSTQTTPQGPWCVLVASGAASRGLLHVFSWVFYVKPDFNG